MLSLGFSVKILTVSYSLIIYHEGSPDCNGVWILMEMFTILFPHFQTVKTVHHHIFKYLDVCLVTPLFLTLFLLLENVVKQGLSCFILPESSF